MNYELKKKSDQLFFFFAKWINDRALSGFWIESSLLIPSKEQII
jgi:hypothetical protein